MNEREQFENAARAFLKSEWVKRAVSPEMVADLKRLTKGRYEGDSEPHYPAAITHFVENVDIDGVPTVFALRISPVKMTE